MLQLLLFVDKRSSSDEQVQEIQSYLENLQSEYSFKLDVVEIEKQPHVVEFLKLVATPALVKVSPAPRQTLAGSDLIRQLEKCWPQWKASQQTLDLTRKVSMASETPPTPLLPDENFYYPRGMELSDEIFILKQEKEELEAQLRFKDQILAMLAHDLRTPLTAASMALDTMELSEKNRKLTAEDLSSLKQKLFAHAKNQFGIMDSMICDLLDNSQAPQARLAITPQSVGLLGLCQEVGSQFDARLQQKSMEFSQDIPQDIPPVYADEELIRQLIGNLLDNAIKYTPAGGKISLSILHRTNQKVQISICDTGPGIPEEKRECIFEDSFRLKRDRNEEGYGLGLAMCSKIVSAHYGQIWVDSTPQEGSCFRFTLLVYK